VFKDATCGSGEETTKGHKLSCVKLAFCQDYPIQRSPPEILHAGHVREVVIYFKFIKIHWGVLELWGSKIAISS